MGASEQFVTMNIPAFLRPLLCSMEHQEVESALCNQQFLDVAGFLSEAA